MNPGEPPDLVGAPAPVERSVRIVSILASLFLAGTVLVTTMQVVLRYGFNYPQAWAEEVSRYLLAWIILLGAAVAVAHRSHIRVDIVETLLPDRLRPPLSIVQRAFELFAYAVLFYSGCIVAWEHRASRFYTIADAPQVLFYLAAPAGAALMVAYLILGLRRGGR